MKRHRSDKSKRDKSHRTRASDIVARRHVYLVIDGYNLMHVTRFKPVRNDEGELRRCRDGLLSLLAEKLPSSQYREVTIVFDSTDAPKHLPDQLLWQHLQVVFARDENSADDFIAELLQHHAHARQLVVVSSDHRVQNAGRRRKATVVDSDEWFDALLEYHPGDGDDAQQEEEGKPEFDSEAGIENPFPPGYFDDLG